MYESYYSFAGMPFQLTPDSRFYFGSQEHRKAMSFLEYGISQREGFVVITGEVGAGKTTLVEHLLATIDPQEYVAARVVTTQLGGYDMLCLIGAGFNLYREGMEKSALIARLMAFFSSLKAQRKHPLVIVDEAQSLTTEAIEELRMLSNLIMNASAPFQGIFLGQPEFRAALSHPNMLQFRQRVIASCHLGALSLEDTRKYIEYRLRRVGWTDDPRFSDGAFEEIYRRSAGIPRRINSLCSRLLLLGYLEESHAIDANSVASVAEEMSTEVGTMGVLPPHNDLATRVEPAPVRYLEHQSAAGLSGREVQSRLEKLERLASKHDRALARVLDLALKYLPGDEPK
ncbi:MAG TPA: XrtA/PEP-CTERM system-associated ATPase [Rhizomicrobium sp.]|jgi:putative secretion ATPase (PEP-CTERM system associated)|nr:XrtA/PEP-CTERM system-associated ATPase [Rhizomicrobium sp.]